MNELLELWVEKFPQPSDFVTYQVPAEVIPWPLASVEDLEYTVYPIKSATEGVTYSNGAFWDMISEDEMQCLVVPHVLACPLKGLMQCSLWGVAKWL